MNGAVVDRAVHSAKGGGIEQYVVWGVSERVRTVLTPLF